MKRDLYELIPEEIVKEIKTSGEASTFTASDGTQWVSCDRCLRWVSADEAIVVPVEDKEIMGYDANGFPVFGAGEMVICPICEKGMKWTRCNRCWCQIPTGMAVTVPAEEDETPMDANGNITVCSECAKIREE